MLFPKYGVKSKVAFDIAYEGYKNEIKYLFYSWNAADKTRGCEK